MKSSSSLPAPNDGKWFFWTNSVSQDLFETTDIVLCTVSITEVVITCSPPLQIPLEKIKNAKLMFSNTVPSWSWVELEIEGQPRLNISLSKPFVPGDILDSSVVEGQTFVAVINALQLGQKNDIERNPYVRNYSKYKHLIEKVPPNGWDPSLSPYIVVDRYMKKGTSVSVLKGFGLFFLLVIIIAVIVAIIVGAQINISIG